MKTKKILKFTLFCSVAVVLLISACSSGGSGNGSSVTVSWNANKDMTVNSTGGGYIVYYSNQQGFDTSAASGSVDVPYLSGASAPTSTTLSLSNGKWYIRVVAYGNSVSSSKTYSSASSEYAIQVGN
ncbi:MAG: hypothetical protein WCQ47_00635 [bacterium]